MAEKKSRPRRRNRPALTDEQRKLVEDNINLVHYVVSRSPLRDEYEYDDLVQIGCIGLMYAAIDYDPARGAFSTFAVPGIRYQLLHHDYQQHLQKRDVRRVANCMPEYEDTGIMYGRQVGGRSTCDDPDDIIAAKELVKYVEGIPNDRTRNVLIMHIYGHTLREIGEVCGLSREAIRQIILYGRRLVRGRMASA